MSKLIVGLQKIGIAFFSFHVIRIPGRRSGQMRETVVSPFVVDGRRYLLSLGQLEWVRNARAAGWGLLSRGRNSHKVALVEIKAPESASIVREFPRQIPAGAQFFVRSGLVASPGGPEQFAAAAADLALFRVELQPEA